MTFLYNMDIPETAPPRAEVRKRIRGAVQQGDFCFPDFASALQEELHFPFRSRPVTAAVRAFLHEIVPYLRRSFISVEMSERKGAPTFVTTMGQFISNEQSDAARRGLRYTDDDAVDTVLSMFIAGGTFSWHMKKDDAATILVFLAAAGFPLTFQDFRVVNCEIVPRAPAPAPAPLAPVPAAR